MVRLPRRFTARNDAKGVRKLRNGVLFRLPERFISIRQFKWGLPRINFVNARNDVNFWERYAYGLQ